MFEWYQRWQLKRRIMKMDDLIHRSESSLTLLEARLEQMPQDHKNRGPMLLVSSKLSLALDMIRGQRKSLATMLVLFDRLENMKRSCSKLSFDEQIESFAMALALLCQVDFEVSKHANQ